MKTKILNILKNTDGYVSGEEISRTLNVSRSVVWKHIKALKKSGYVISSVTNKGYRLEGSDVISTDEIQSMLDTEFIGRTLFYTKETDSTNNDCKRNSDMPDGTVYIADIQTGGKGRRGKVWVSPPGSGAWFSVLLKPNIRPEAISKITLIAGLAVCRAVGCGAKIKYPNDIVIGTRKVCGILTELSAELDTVNYAVCGIGINTAAEAFEGELADKATSIFIETGQRPSRPALIAKVLNELEKLYKLFLEQGLEPIMEEYKANCVTYGSEVVVTYNKEQICGICSDITPNGSIIINTGREKLEISSGEVSVRGIYGYV